MSAERGFSFVHLFYSNTGNVKYASVNKWVNEWQLSENSRLHLLRLGHSAVSRKPARKKSLNEIGSWTSRALSKVKDNCVKNPREQENSWRTIMRTRLWYMKTIFLLSKCFKSLLLCGPLLFTKRFVTSTEKAKTQRKNRCHCGQSPLKALISRDSYSITIHFISHQLACAKEGVNYCLWIPLPPWKVSQNLAIRLDVFTFSFCHFHTLYK